jgi:hypothetical protein
VIVFLREVIVFLREVLRMRRLLIIPAALLIIVVAWGAASQTAVVVKVKNSFDKPVDNAAVILDFLGSHQMTKLGKRKPIHWEVHSNQDGVAHFPPVPQGTIQIQVVAKGYQTFGDKYDIDTDSKAIAVTLNPPQQQYSAHPPLKPSDSPKQ